MEKGEFKPGGARVGPEDACGACVHVPLGTRNGSQNQLFLSMLIQLLGY